MSTESIFAPDTDTESGDVEQDIAALLERHHAARKQRDRMETRLGRQLPPFKDELSDLQLSALVDHQVAGGVLHGDSPGVKVWPGEQLADRTRTAAQLAGEMKAVRDGFAAGSLRRQLAEIEAKIEREYGGAEPTE